MASIFDGMAGLLNETFGDTVTVTPPGQVARVLVGVFREEPIEDSAEDGRAIVILAPVLRLPTASADGIGRGAGVLLADGRRYKVLNRLAVASPAADRFIEFELEKQE